MYGSLSVFICFGMGDFNMTSTPMKICIFGLGYVGCVSTACLANFGHDIVGVDVSESKVDLLNRGLATIVEKDVDVLVAKGAKEGRIRATTDHLAALEGAHASIICVGTPNDKSGHLDLRHIRAVARGIAEGLAKGADYHIVVIRSTVLPGANEEVGQIIEEFSGRVRGEGFDVVSNPEFLREGTAVADFHHPPYTVIGAGTDRAFEVASAMYSDIDAPVRRVPIRVAETIKMINNSFHALKVTFANEVGNICKKLDVDSRAVMALFCEDKQLNLSSYYLKPGFAYGGSCLPKDLSALKLIAHDNYLNTPLVASIDQSNAWQKARLVEMIQERETRKIGILGFSFKAGTDDLRNSPVVEVAEVLLGKGYDLRIYDHNVHFSNLMGANREYILDRIPHLENLISDDLESVVADCDLVVVANREKEFDRLPDLLRAGQAVIDLVGIPSDNFSEGVDYEGICW